MQAKEYVSVHDLVNEDKRYLNCTLRLAQIDEFKSPSNPDGIVLPQPSLARQTANDALLSYGMQALDSDRSYVFAGYHNRTFTFIDDTTNIPLQIFEHELPDTYFCIIKLDT